MQITVYTPPIAFSQAARVWPSRGSASLTVIVVHNVVSAPPTRRQHYRAAIDCPPAIFDHMLCPTIACSSPVYTVYSTCSVTWSHQRTQPSRLTALSPLQPASAGCDGSCLTRVDAVYPHTARALASTPARTASRCAGCPTGASRLRSRGCPRDCTARTGLQ